MATRATPEPATGEPSHSGRLLLRMPSALHADLARRADAERVSLNQYIVTALQRAVAPGAGPSAEPRSLPRSVRNALVVNAVVVALATATAIALLVVAWR